MEENNEPDLRSESSLEEVYVKFVNLTSNTVELLWVNYLGMYERYALLRRKQYMDVNTYRTHPWLATDVRTKDRMKLNRKFVYQPVPWKLFCEMHGLKHPIVPSERRFVVYITLPVYSLRYRALLRVRDLLEDPDDVERLDLPQSLKADLKKVIGLKDKVKIIVAH